MKKVWSAMYDDAREMPLKPDSGSMWTAARKVLARLANAWSDCAPIDEALDLVVEAVGADRGLLILSLPHGANVVVHARGEGRSLSAVEREEISRTVLREVRKTHKPSAFSPRGGPADGSMAVLGIAHALAVPLRDREGGPIDGVLYVDWRRVDAVVDALHVEFLESLAGLLGALAAHHVRLANAQEQLRDARAVEAPAEATLEELLMPASMASIRGEVESSLEGDASIFVLGESGTGKTLLAHAIANASRRRPIVRAMLGSSDDLNTVTSELFGHERGAYSGAVARRIGLVELAHRGTLILDEVLNLSPNAQKLLLDFTQFRTYRPLGWDRAEPKRADVRIIAATNGDLEAAMRDGRFREDLYFRLATVTIQVPPLRERRADIPQIAESYLRRLDPHTPWTLDLALRRRLVAEDLGWSGNVRQLERVILRARDRARARDPQSTELALEHVEPRDLGGLGGKTEAPRSTARSSVDRWAAVQRERALLETTEREVLAQLVAEHGGVISKVARAVSLPRSTLVSRLEALGLDPRRGGRDE